MARLISNKAGTLTELFDVQFASFTQGQYRCCSHRALLRAEYQRRHQGEFFLLQHLQGFADFFFSVFKIKTDKKHAKG